MMRAAKSKSRESERGAQREREREREIKFENEKTFFDVFSHKKKKSKKAQWRLEEKLHFSPPTRNNINAQKEREIKKAS